MKIQLILPLVGLLLIGGCSKSSGELFELSEENLKNNQIDQAVGDLEKLLNKYPQDKQQSAILPVLDIVGDKYAEKSCYVYAKDL